MQSSVGQGITRNANEWKLVVGGIPCLATAKESGKVAERTDRFGVGGQCTLLMELPRRASRVQTGFRTSPALKSQWGKLRLFSRLDFE